MRVKAFLYELSRGIKTAVMLKKTLIMAIRFLDRPAWWLKERHRKVTRQHSYHTIINLILAPILTSIWKESTTPLMKKDRVHLAVVPQPGQVALTCNNLQALAHISRTFLRSMQIRRTTRAFLQRVLWKQLTIIALVQLLRLLMIKLKLSILLSY